MKKYIPDFGQGSVLERRTSEQAVPPEAEGHLNADMYILLQPIAAAFKKYLAGDSNAVFPPWTTKPPGPFVHAT